MKFRKAISTLVIILMAAPALGALAYQEEKEKSKGGIVIEPGKEPSKNPPKNTSPAKPDAPLPPPLPPLATYQFSVATVDEEGSVTNRRKGENHFYTEDLSNGVILEMAHVPGGRFLMGSPDSDDDRFSDEEPQHEVTVETFYMGKFEITQQQWRAVAALPKVKRELEDNPSRFKGDDRPVEQVSWEDAIEFCARLSKKTGRQYRLPTEAEWEYACRAEAATRFHFGETITPQLVNYNGKQPFEPESAVLYRGRTTPAGELAEANGFGLYDMHGNVSEWCMDVWHNNYDGAPTDGETWTRGGDRAYRVLRGGSWFLNSVKCRAAYRFKSPASDRLPDAGFRIVFAGP